MQRKIINAYPRFKEFNDLAMAGDNVAAVRKGLDFLRFVGKEYERKQVYDHSKWDGDDFMVKAFEDIPCITDDDCEKVCDLIVEEKKYQCLLKILKQNSSSTHRTEYFKRYARYMSEDDQREYAEFVIEDLRLRLRYADSGSYHYIVDEIMLLCSTCEVAKSMGVDFVAEIMVKYRNRKALMRELTSKD